VTEFYLTSGAALQLPDFIEEFPENIRLKIIAKRHKLQQSHDAFFQKSQEEFGTLDQQLDPSTLSLEAFEELSKEIAKLRMSIMEHCKWAALVCPELSLTSLRELLTKLQRGPFYSKLLACNNKYSISELTDDDDTWDYLVRRYQGHGMRELQRIFGVNTPDALAAAFAERGIATMPQFVQNVLEGNQELLKNQEEVFRRLENYTKDFRRVWYTRFAGKTVNEVSRASIVAGRIAYLAAMILTTLIPVIHDPGSAVIGLLGPPVYWYSLTLQRILAIGSYHPGLFEAVALFRFVIQRPLLKIFSRNRPDLSVYDSADIWGKMRILSMELLTGNALLASGSVGSFIQGSSISYSLFQTR
jgi:hypothetical protein